MKNQLVNFETAENNDENGEIIHESITINETIVRFKIKITSVGFILLALFISGYSIRFGDKFAFSD
jgi:hypothetical protein